MSSKPFSLTASLLASQVRGWRGSVAFKPARTQPAKLLELYEFEASPFCRLVREVLTELDLDVMIYPCPQGGTRFRPKVQKLGGKQQYPFLVDPNTGRQLYESADIIDYLGKTYGRRARNPKGWRRQANVIGSTAASALRFSGPFKALLKGQKGMLEHIRGLNANPSKAPAKPLELYSFESSPYSRPVRERMSELELPYILRNFGKDKWADMGPESVRVKLKAPVTGRNRKKMFELTGRTQVPYLVDANTGVAMHESAKILQHLDETYAA